MDTLPVKPERMAALEQYAQQPGKELAEVLDDALAKFSSMKPGLPKPSRKALPLPTEANLLSMRMCASGSTAGIPVDAHPLDAIRR
jgi:hypothetical protein